MVSNIGDTAILKEMLLPEFCMRILFDVVRAAVMLRFQFPDPGEFPRMPPILNSRCSTPWELFVWIVHNAASTDGLAH